MFVRFISRQRRPDRHFFIPDDLLPRPRAGVSVESFKKYMTWITKVKEYVQQEYGYSDPTTFLDVVPDEYIEQIAEDARQVLADIGRYT